MHYFFSISRVAAFSLSLDLPHPQIRGQFEKQSSIQLRDFIVPELSEDVKNLLDENDGRDKLGEGRASLDYKVGEGKGWKVIGPAHKQRFLECEGGGFGDPLGDKLSSLKEGLLSRCVQPPLTC